MKKSLLVQTLFMCIAPLNLILSTTYKEEKIAVVGTGYVGLVLGACLADFGHQVLCADVDTQKIEKLNNNIIPIYEPGLPELVQKNQQNKRLIFTSDVASAIKACDIIFIAVGTPMAEDGSADLKAVEAVATTIGKNLNSYKIICTKSTVPVGTGNRIKQIINSHAQGNKFDVISNPEFLREGSAVYDFMHPDRVVVGGENQEAMDRIKKVYFPLVEAKIPFLYADLVTSEIIKYASNAFLATKISFINEISNLCDETRADVNLVSQGIGLDSRIGHAFLKPGPGFGGSCFPKDTEALIKLGKDHKINLHVIQAAVNANKQQHVQVKNKIAQLLDKNLKNKNIAVLGLAFKANTDDIRYSPALHIIDHLIENKCNIRAFDPIAMDNVKTLYPHVKYCDDAYQAVENADLLVIMTEWPAFKELDFKRIKELMHAPNIVDSRNILDKKTMLSIGYNFLNMGNASTKFMVLRRKF